MLIRKSSIQFFRVLTFLIFFQNFYRYIFKFNATVTSPTYSDTPFILQIAKYVAIFLLLLLLLIHEKKSILISKGVLFFHFSVLFTSIVLVLNNIFTGAVNIEYLEVLFWYVIFCVFLLVDKLFFIEFKNWFLGNLKLILWVLLISNFIVILNYFLFGRLPALAYEGLMVRFGGMWDDPNGFGFFCAAVFPYAYNIKDRKLMFGLIVSIILTLSLSSYLTLFFVLLLLIFNNKGKLNISLLKPIVLFMAVVFISAWIYWDELLLLYEFKSGSIDEHADLAKVKIGILDVFERNMFFHETWYLAFLINLFPISLLIIIGVCHYCISNIKVTPKNIFQYYIIAFLFGNLFIPLFIVYPLNLLFFLFVAVELKSDCPDLTPVIS